MACLLLKLFLLFFLFPLHVALQLRLAFVRFALLFSDVLLALLLTHTILLDYFLDFKRFLHRALSKIEPFLRTGLLKLTTFLLNFLILIFKLLPLLVDGHFCGSPRHFNLQPSLVALIHGLLLPLCLLLQHKLLPLLVSPFELLLSMIYCLLLFTKDFVGHHLKFFLFCPFFLLLHYGFLLALLFRKELLRCEFLLPLEHFFRFPLLCDLLSLHQLALLLLIPPFSLLLLFLLLRNL